MIPAAWIIFSAIAGAVVASILACIPGLHVYNVLGLLVVAVHALTVRQIAVPPEIMAPCFAGMIVAYSMLNAIPSVLLAAPDESALFTVLPGQKYLMEGRGQEGVLLTVAGGAAGLGLLIPGLGLAAPACLPLVHRVFQPHNHWILWCVICFMLMSEWPKGGQHGQAGGRKFLAAWISLGAGLLTFLLSGLLGFLLFYRPVIDHQNAFQNLMPAFIGLFTMPWLIFNLITRVEIPVQHPATGFRWNGYDLLKGVFAGGLGGGFAAFFPVITGGVGGFLAGHATGVNNNRVFLISQGASKLVYYVGGLLLFFVPGLHVVRGGGAGLLQLLYKPASFRDFYMILAAMAFAGGTACLMTLPLLRGMIFLLERVGYRRISFGALGMVMVLVFWFTGWKGMLVMGVSAGIGMIPVVFGSRRMNALGVILLPMACNMSGFGPVVAGWLGLL